MAGLFSPDTLRFLADLRDNNNREWFTSHKATYESAVRDPALQFIALLGPELAALSPYLVADPRPVGGSMLRIQRDTRFSHDKTPYKTAVAMRFLHRLGQEGAAPGFYLRIEPGNCAVGAGIWRPEPRALDAIRQRIVAEPDRWQQVTAGKTKRSACGFIGESLKRAPSGYDPNHPLVDDLKRKDYALSVALADADVATDDFPTTVLGHFADLAPFVQFLCDACGVKF